MDVLATMAKDPLPRYEVPAIGQSDKPKVSPPSIFTGWSRPPVIYKSEQCERPGYALDDLEKLMHPEDFVAMLNEVPICGVVDGREIVYQLDYIRWRNRLEELG